MSDRSENTPQPEYLLPVTKCPTPADWERMLGPEGIQQSFDDRLNEHVEHCAQCRDYLENRSTEPGLSLAAIASVLPDVVAARPMTLSGISVPEGYVAAGSPVYGGRGLVFKAIDIVSGRAVAIKMSKYRHETNQAERQALEHEAAAVQSLSHPNIVHIYEILAENDPPAIIMEWVDGGTLQEVLKNHRPSIDEIVQLMKQMADAVSHAHKHLVLHRDIKPSNILMTGDDFHYPKLSDFGLAKLGQEGEGWSTATEFIGTPVYMAPESFRKERNAIGPTVDIYSLGAVLYRLLSGKVPFEGTNPIELGMRVVQEEVTPIRQFQKAVPKDLEKICLKCLRKEPEERYQDAAALKSDLVRFEEGKPVRASRDGTITRWRRWARRDPKAARQAAAFGVFLIGVIIALASLLQRSRSSEKLAQQKLSEKKQAMGLASPIFKRILANFQLKPDEVRNIKKFIKLRKDIDYEPVDLRDRLDHHYLTLELADSLRKFPDEIVNSISLAKLAREKIGKLINDHGDEAHMVIYGRNKDDTYRETVLEKALIRYSDACQQLYDTYPKGIKLGLGSPVPAEDPDQELVKEAIAVAERVMRLKPDATEPIGQIAHYYLALAEAALYRENRDQAIDYYLRSIRFTEEMRELHSSAVDRWKDDTWNRQYLAMVYLEKPVDFVKYLDAVSTVEKLRESEKLINHEFRAEILVDIWLHLVIKYKALVAFGEYSKALVDIERSIENLPQFNENTVNGPVVRRECQFLNIDRLSLLKLMNTDHKELEHAETEVSLMIDKIADSDEKALAHAYFELFKPDPQKRSPKAALQWLRQIKDQTDLSFIKEICELVSGEGVISERFDKPEILAKRRCNGSFVAFQQIIFETERLAQTGQKKAAGDRMKSIEAWLKNDKLVPCFLLVRVNEIRDKLTRLSE